MRVQVPIAKPQPWVLPVTVVCLALGILIALMLKQSTPEPNALDPNIRPEEQARILQLENEDFRNEIKKLRDEKNELIDDIANQKKNVGPLQQELDELRIRGGLTRVEGPGIVITLDDSNTMKNNAPEMSPNENPSALIIHDIDLMMLVNELREAGAEAIAVNDQRVVGSTAIRCVGPVVHINDRPVSAPFIIQAIGKPDALYGGMNLPAGVLDQLRALSIRIDVEKKEKMNIPAVVVLPALEVGKVVKNASKDKDTENKR